MSQVTGAGLTVVSCLGAEHRAAVLGERARALIGREATLIDMDPETLVAQADPSSARILLTGWGAPRLERAVLDRLPELELVVHAAGSIRDLVTDQVWARGIRVTTAASANAVPVADFTVAQIVLCLKNAWRLALRSRDARGPVRREGVRGADGAVVGVVGLGLIGTLVAERLRDTAPGVEVIAYDPFAPGERCARLGVTRHDLGAVFSRSDVLTLHAPLTPATRQMIGRRELERLPLRASFINTARGGLVDHDALAAVLAERGDLLALLDVTDPEPLPAGHRLAALDNVVLTPHIAGSLGTERERLGIAAAGEIARFAAGLPLRYEIDRERLDLTA
ncbi:hydroxyacid dehydrogenase [Kineosporia sp. J2-2]|uniref:Hydroxyacid dehydrogenase n=1 Tax=Kineosporia corallincola TaxID=2835133 RepID=A0ABS5TBS4_9ACTN|nr:hydroxyacid dehydrogenase [Kineosporia corallincola]MBT0768527.1 hydroxyacid dehydrogenase [Kineosporia corallincola]